MRRSLRLVPIFLLIVLGIGLAGIVLWLAPQHWQIRRIAPALPNAAELLALRDDPGGPVAVELLTIARQPSPRGVLTHSVVLVRWADGRAFMIDAGMDRAGTEAFAELMKRLWGADDARFEGDVAEQLGPSVHDVVGVGFTHLHIDHTQGVGAFCAARGEGARVYQTTWQVTKHNSNTEEGAEIVGSSCLDAQRIEGEGLSRIEGFPGLGVVPLGGHTPGSTAFAVAEGRRLWLFSGDTTNTRAALLDDVGKGFLYSGILVPENTARTAVLRRWFAELDAHDEIDVVVSHDPTAGASPMRFEPRP